VTEIYPQIMKHSPVTLVSLLPTIPVLVGGNIALDFANTATGLEEDDWRDYLTDPLALLAWCKQAQGIPEPDFRHLLRVSVLDEDEADRFLGRARQVRDALNRLFAAAASGEPPAGADLDLLNQEMAEFRRQERIVWSPEGFRVESPSRRTLDALLAPMLQAAFDLLTGPALGRVRQCASTRCEWLFLDTSKNGRRRWCRMSVCGNREKGRRHHARAGLATGGERQ
jgi:predicted RNA-binding Zn ribbon-like protein